MNFQFLKGLKDGIPIALGYISVGFGFGLLAAKAGLSILAATSISATSVTSAGQAAGVAIIAAGGTYFEMALTQFVINIRYSLMGLSLSQKLDDSFTVPQRLLVSYGITDEIFAVAYANDCKLTARYMYGLIIISFFGWTMGTFFGAAAGQILPKALTDAMGLLLYGMFIAVFIPAAKTSKGVLTAVLCAALISVLFYYVFSSISSGFAVIISAIAAAVISALLFPLKGNDQEAAE